MADYDAQGFAGGSGPRRLMFYRGIATAPGAVGANDTLDVALACVGAVVGDIPCVTLQTALDAGLVFGGARVSAADVVTYRLGNHTAGPIAPAANVADVVVATGR